MIRRKGNGREGPVMEAYCETGVDTTALGGHMFRELIEEHIPIRSIEFGGVTKIKRKMLSDLRTAIDEGRLIMPTDGEWREVRAQLLNYKLMDRKIEQDLVMGLAIIAKLIRSAPVASDEPAVQFEYGMVEKPDRTDDGINSQTIRRRMRERNRQRLLTERPDAE
jgi:hypothetical protein